MYPDGTKNIAVSIPSGLKLFLNPYVYLMIDHFFRESLPVYDMNSLDKPNEYDEDYETYPEMHTVFKLGDSLICLADSESESTLGIACQASLEFEFKREKIKLVK